MLNLRFRVEQFIQSYNITFGLCSVCSVSASEVYIFEYIFTTVSSGVLSPNKRRYLITVLEPASIYQDRYNVTNFHLQRTSEDHALSYLNNLQDPVFSTQLFNEVSMA